MNNKSEVALLLAGVVSLLIFSTGLISAAQIELLGQHANQTLSQGETLIAKLSGNFVDVPSSGNLFIYKDGHIKSPSIFYITKIGSDYYFYTQLSGETAGNYSVMLKNTRYSQSNRILSDDIVENFSISSDSADFYISPGFVETDSDYSIVLTNLRNYGITVDVNPENTSSASGFFDSLFGGPANTSSKQTISLSADETKNVSLSFDSSLNTSSLETVTLSSENTSYSVPVYMITENKTSSHSTGKLAFSPILLNVSLATNSSASRVIYIENIGNVSVENISLSVSNSLKPYVNLSDYLIDEISENSSVKIVLFFVSSGQEANIEGQLTAQYINASDDSKLYEYSAILLHFVKGYVPTFEDNTSSVNTETCSALNGTICSTNETCSGNSVDAWDGSCCVGTCQAKPESSSIGTYIGWGLVILAVLFLLWFFFKKYKKVNNSVDLLKVARGK